MASSVPNLRLDDLVIDVDAAGGEFDANGGFGFQAEFVLRESRQEVRFPNARVSDQHHLEQVVVIIVRSVRTHLPLFLPTRSKGSKDSNLTVFSLILLWEFNWVCRSAAYEPCKLLQHWK